MYWLIKYLIRRWHEYQGRRNAGGSAAPQTAGTAAPRTGRRAVPRGVRPSVQRASAAARGPLALLAHQVRYDLRASLRNPRARFFTFFFPIVLLVVFAGVFGHGHTVVDGVRVKLSRFYVPGILAMSIVVASYASLVISITTMRQTGVLKRRRATPVPPAMLIAGQALSTVVVVSVMATLLLVIAKLGYGVGFAPAAIVAIACTAAVGTVAFACIAYAVSGLIGSPDAAQPVVQMTMLPLWFISGVFIPNSNLSSGLRSVASLFPVEHVAAGMHRASVNASFTGAISPKDLLALAAWAVAAAGFAAWRFSWLPSTAAA